MINKNEFYEYIKTLILFEIKDDTKFFDDVGIAGLDADNMMLKFGERYNIDLSTYNPDLYDFDMTEYGFFPYLWKLIKGQSPGRTTSFSALHLFKVAQNGKWFDPSNGGNASE